MRTARSWFAHLLAALGVVIWLQAIWPDGLSDIRFFLLALYAGVLFLPFARLSQNSFRTVN
jgi:hypothetical protein